ncbi:MAG: hypothetical protein GC179_25815 [Anaerolineaceae bacterium]|nr:hypothetical protein [Anaerolineaceae bacterium]
MAQTSECDISHHQNTNINWQQVFQSGQRFAFIRASLVGTETKKPSPDRNFEKHWAAARTVNGLLLGTYHYFLPVPDIREQIEFFVSMVGNRKVDLPMALDFENSLGVDKETTSRAIADGLQLLEDKIGYRPIIYTGSSWWNSHTVASPRWSQHDLWIANYGNPAPVLPRDWINWRFWQWTEKGSVAGMPGLVDVDWFNGDETQLKLYAASHTTSKPPSPQPDSGYRVEVLSTVNIRKGPGTNFDIVGSLKTGSQSAVLDVAGNDIWAQIGTNRWAAYVTGGQQLCVFKAGTPAQIIVAVTRMNVRFGPSVSTADVGDLLKDTVLNVSDLSGTDVWIKIGDERWAAFAKDSMRFMKWLA